VEVWIGSRSTGGFADNPFAERLGRHRAGTLIPLT
jgi:hypothetical protein